MIPAPQPAGARSSRIPENRRTRPSRRADTFRLLREYVRTPRSVGAVAPCSPALAREMVRPIDWTGVRTVVELGAGTGAITSLVTSSASADCRIVLIERNPRLVNLLRYRHPAADVVHGDAQHALEHCRRLGVNRADVILAGLPWASLGTATQWRCLRTIRLLLADDGSFATYAQVQALALPAARRFARRLHEEFAHVAASRVVWRSMPPSLVYHCRGVVRTPGRAGAGSVG